MTDSNNAQSVRSSIRAAIDARMAFEESANGGDKTIKQLLSMLKEVDSLDSAICNKSTEMGFNWDSFINSHRVTSARCNIYAIPKAWQIMGAIASGKFSRLGDSDPATIATTILAMGEGIQNEKTIANRVNVLMTGLRRWQAFNNPVSRGPAVVLSQFEKHKNFVYFYASGPTQCGSSIRALEALGIVRNVGKEGNCKLWKFATLDDKTRELVNMAFSAIVANFYDVPSKSPMGAKTYPQLPSIPALMTGNYSEMEKKEQETKATPEVPKIVPIVPTQESLALLDAIAKEQAETPAKTKAVKKATPAKTKATPKPKAGETVSLAEIAKTAKAEKTKSRAKKAETETPALELSK